MSKTKLLLNSCKLPTDFPETNIEPNKFFPSYLFETVFVLLAQLYKLIILCDAEENVYVK